jgi:hypothetical protein
MTPTQRSLAKLKADNWTVAVVEKWNPWARVRSDLFGFADLLAMSPTRGILAVQTTSGGNVAARIAKIRNEPRAGIWLASGGRIVVHGWRKVGPRGKRKVWECREVEIESDRVA